MFKSVLEGLVMVVGIHVEHDSEVADKMGLRKSVTTMPEVVYAPHPAWRRSSISPNTDTAAKGADALPQCRCLQATSVVVR